MKISKTRLAYNYIILIIFAFVFITPPLWIVYTSFKPRIITFAMPPVWLFKPTLENYIQLIQKENLFKYFTNSLIIVGVSTILAVAIGSLAAFAFSRIKFRRKQDILFWILSTRMIPPVVALIPLFLLIKNLGLYDTHLIMILIYTSFGLPFTIWVMISFINEIPIDIEESAMIDGCSKMGAFWKVTLPLAKSGVLSTALLLFIISWNEFLTALIFTSQNAKTLPIMTTGFVSAKGIMWGEMTAGATIIIIPVIIFVLLTQKFLVRGLTFGAVK